MSVPTRGPATGRTARTTRTASVTRTAAGARDPVEPPVDITIATPTGWNVSPATGRINLTLNAVVGAVGYQYERKATGEGSFSLLDDTTDTFYSDEDVSGTDPYTYRARAYRVDATVTTYSGYTAEIARALPQAGGSDAITPSDIIQWPRMTVAGVEIPFTGDAGQTGTATVRYQINSGGIWYDALPMERIQPTQPGTARGGTTTTIQLETSGIYGAGKALGDYIGWEAHILDAHNKDGGAIIDSSVVTAFNKDTQTVTVSPALDNAPTAGTFYRLQDPRLSRFATDLCNFDPGDIVNVEVTIDAADGVNGQSILTADIQLRDEDVTPAASVTMDKFVAVGGSDAAAGSEVAPWATVQKAADYINTTGGNVQFGSGRFQARDVSITGIGGLFAEFPCLDDNLNVINAGNHTIFSYGIVTGPSGGDAPLENVWTAVAQATRTGPDTGTIYTNIYEYTPVPGAIVDYIGWSATYDGDPEMIGKGKNGIKQETLPGKPVITTDAQLIQWIFENEFWNYGWYPSIQTAGKVYVRMPPNAVAANGTNPNNFYITIGKGSALIPRTGGAKEERVDGATFRYSGIKCVGYHEPIIPQSTARWHVYDHFILTGNRTGIDIFAQSTPTLEYAEDILIEYFLIKETALRAQPGGDGTNYINRLWVKNTAYWTFNGVTEYWTNYKDGGNAEGKGIGGQGGCKRLVIRNGEIDGLFNGQGCRGVGFDYHAGSGLEMNNVYIHNLPDDAVAEQEPYSFLLSLVDVRVEHCAVFASTVSSEWGPITILRPRVWQIGIEEMVEVPFTKINPMGLKSGDKNRPAAIMLVVHGTFASDQPLSKILHLTNGGSPGFRPLQFWRNNIMAMGREIVRSGDRAEGDRPGGWDEDYNLWAAPSGTQINQVDTDTIALYRTRVLNFAGNPRAVSGISTAELITTPANHRFRVGDMVRFSGTNSTPALTGPYTVATVPSARTFTISGVNVTVAGTTGTVSRQSGVHTNNFGNAGNPDESLTDTSWILALFTDFDTGDLTLDPVAGAEAIGTAFFVPNLSGHAPALVNFGAEQ